MYHWNTTVKIYADRRLQLCSWETQAFGELKVISQVMV
jgi:hypothetical protein